MTRNFNKILFVLVVAVFVLACNALAGGNQPAAEVPPTEEFSAPPVVEETQAPPEPEPAPVETEAPTEAPPAEAPSGAVGDTITGDLYEVTVTDARELKRVYMGNYYYYPKDGQMFVEIIARVSNLSGSEAAVPWENIYVEEENGDAWYPTWGGYKAVAAGKKVDGASISVNQITDGKEEVKFDEDAVFRMIWFVNRDTNKTSLMFYFANQAKVEVIFEH